VLLGLFGSFGMQEILLILVIVVFLFGAKRIPEIARGVGEGIRTFRSSLKGGEQNGPDAKGEPHDRNPRGKTD